jgi:hypothetical protein
MAEEWRGKIGSMEPERRDLYLAGDSLVRLSVIDDEGRPYVVPLWYHWDGESFWFVIRERSAIARFMKERPGVGLVIDEMEVVDPEHGRYFAAPKVFAQGDVELIEEPNVGGQWVDIARQMAVRYLGENGPSYIVPTLEQPRWLFRLTPTVMKTWEGVGWAKKYWVETDKGPSYGEVHGG